MSESSSSASDSRISRLLRQVAKVESLQSLSSTATLAISQLEQPDNQKYAQKAFPHLIATLSETFKGLSSGISWKEEAMDIFVDLLLALHNVQEESGSCRIAWWLIDLILKKASRPTALYAIHDVFVKLMTKMSPDDLHPIHLALYKAVEKVDVGHSFKILSALFVFCLDRMQDLNNPCFPDFVDVIIGWMVDEQLKEDHSEFCGDILLLLRPHFQEDPYFPKTLLNQILEDMEAALDGIAEPDPTTPLKRLFMLAKAYVTILKTDSFPEKGFITDSTERMIATSLKILNGVIPSSTLSRYYMTSLLEVVNEAISLSPGVDGPFTRTFIKTELECFRKDDEWKNWSRDIFLKVWEGLCVYVEGVVSVTQISDDTIELTDSLMEFADTMPESRERILLIQSLFRTRSVPLLQKVYQWHLSKLETHSILFILAGLSDIAVNKSGSILSLWALQPPIFTLLMEIASKENDSRVKQSTLNLLRCHCSIHSHFVSSLTSTGSFSSDSPGTKFIPALMTFWVDQLQQHDNIKNHVWLWGWIHEFLTSAAPYAPALCATNPLFFSEILQIIITNLQHQQPTKTNLQNKEITSDKSSSEWQDITKEILLLMSRNSNFSQVAMLQELLESTCMQVLLDPSTSPDAILLFQDILINLPVLIICDKRLTTSNSAHHQSLAAASEVSSFTTTEFYNFLHQLLTTNKYSDADMSSSQVRSGADYLIRSKLRTPLGKPQELFGQIQSVLKKRSESTVLPKWKLDFLFLLEQSFTLWIHGSLVDNVELNDTIRSFYKTNKTPCMEWLKRIRHDIVDAGFECGDFFGAFYNAVNAQDNSKVARAYFHMRDSEGLKSMNEIAGWHYLQGNFEKAIELLNFEEEEESFYSKRDPLKSQIFLKASTILSEAIPCEEKEHQNATENVLLNMRSELTAKIGISILDVQMKSNSSFLDLFHKKELKIIDNEEELGLWTLLKACGLARNYPKIPQPDKTALELRLAESMLDHENIQWTEKYLSDNCGVDFTELRQQNDISVQQFLATTDTLGNNNSQSLFSQLLLAAKVLLLSKDITTSAWLYSKLLEISINNPVENWGWNDNKFKSELMVKVGTKLSEFPGQLELILTNLNMKDPDNYNEQQGSLEKILDKALHFTPTCENAWLTLGNFHYEFPQWIEGKNSNNSHKQQALESYNNYFRLKSSNFLADDDRQPNNAPQSRNNREGLIISRMITLCNEGYYFDPSELPLSEKWLDFLPKIAQTPSLREHILQRFPQQSALYLLSHDSTTEEANKAPLRRKGLFDPTAFSITDISEDPLSHAHGLAGTASCSNCTSTNNTSNGEYVLRSPLNIPEAVRILGREVLRIGTSPEELWSWNLQRILIDWNRRVSSLKKDLARDPDPLKVNAYIKPVVRFLEELWKLTEDTAESPAQLSFILKNSQEITSHLRNISNCTSVEALLNSFEKLLFHADKFDSVSSYRSQLGQLSPKMAKFQEWGTECTVLGIPAGLSIVAVNPVVVTLATKTKPKKIRFRCSNGKSYEYLVKGNENLNVDSGMMQFLSVTKQFLEQPAWTYAVTPLGKRGGLIQMVSGALPIFLLYKKYLQRHHGGDRTSEIFWRRMHASGATDRTNPQILKEVFLSLQTETPNDLISKELFLCAHDAPSWFSSVQGFTRDSGVSSAIGYLLGIGDRHLDNILVDLHHGKLVHVDFSLMFDKGASLRVPEIVPFRLTQNFSAALQYPGPSGPYSVYLEDSLLKFQKEEELALFCAEGIAFSCQIDEDSPVDSVAILQAEVTSALILLKLRYKNIFRTAQTVRLELVETVTELSSHATTIQESQSRLENCELNIENLTIALSELKEAQGDLRKLSDLRGKSRQCVSQTLEEAFTTAPQLMTATLLMYFTENVGKKCLATENDSQWANSMEKLVSNQLQGEVQSKFNLAEENSKIQKSEKDVAVKLGKKLNKWRRLLANLDPLICFIAKEVDEESRLGSFKAFVENQWIPFVAHFWLHSTTDILLAQKNSFAQQCEAAELILEEIFLCLNMLEMEEVSEIVHSDLVKTNPSMDALQTNRINGLLQSFRKKLQGFNKNSSAESLMADASSVDNLSQMFEGWTAWV